MDLLSLDWSKVNRLMFVCHGNICRSPMAEFITLYMLEQEGLKDIFVASCATSTEELGNPLYPPAREELLRHNIPLRPHRARQACLADLDKFDLFLCAESINVRNLARVVGPAVLDKTCRLLDLTDRPRDIADPWWTGDFTETWRDLQEGCHALLEKLRQSHAC